MFKFFVPLMLSAFTGNLISISVVWLISSGFILFSSELTQMFFFMSGLAKPMVVLSFWVSGMMLYASVSSLKNVGGKWFIGCVFFLNFFLVLAFTSKTLLSFYFLFESTLVPTLFLVLGWGNQPERLQAATYLLLYTLLGSLPLLVGIGLISSNMSVCVFFPHKSAFISSVVWVAMMVGLFVKMPMYPVHLWLPKAHVEAPLAGSMALAGVLLKLGAFGILVVMSFVGCSLGVESLILSVCLWGSVITSIICFRQTDMKSLIAYSSIGHMGLVLAGLLTCTELGIKGAVVVVVAHGLSSPAMFNFANIVYESSFSRSVVLCKGLISVFPALCMSLFLVCATNMAAPPSINLVGEIWLVISVIGFSFLFSVLIGLMSFLVGVYTLYVYTSICHGSAPSLFNSGHLFSGCNHFVMFMQLWPLAFFTASLYTML